MNGGCISGKWVRRGEPVEVNNVNITNTTAQKHSNGDFLGLSQIVVHAKCRPTCN